MYFQAIVLAALSAGALANTGPLFLTAFPPEDTKCSGNPAGYNVSLTDNLTGGAGEGLTSPCIYYAPKHNQNIKLDYGAYGFTLEIFSDAHCKDSTGMLIGWDKADDHCIPMNGGSYVDDGFQDPGTRDWQSVKVTMNR